MVEIQQSITFALQFIEATYDYIMACISCIIYKPHSMMSPNVKGNLYMLLAVISFSVMASLVKTIPEVNTTSVTFFRFAVGVGILAILGVTKRIKLVFHNTPFLLLRGLSGGFAVYLLYFSITHLGVSKGTLIVYSYPIFASLFGVIFLGEKVKLFHWFFIASAFVGLSLLSNFNPQNLSSVSIYELLALLSSVLSAVSIIFVKKLHKTDQSTSIFFSQSLIGFWIFIIPTNLAPTVGSYSIALTLIAIGVIAALGQLVMTEAYRFISVSTGSSLNMLVPFFNIFTGYIFFGETLTLKESIGALLIITSCIAVVIGGNLKFRFFGPR